MMKIEVGMYVRYEYEKNVYIGKIKFISEVMCGLDETLQINIDSCIEEILKRDIIKASHNIIDLIEVGDYVNGIRVGYINKGEDCLYALTDENTRDVICGYDSDGFTKPLHSIVTKEQFEQMGYKVGDYH